MSQFRRSREKFDGAAQLDLTSRAEIMPAAASYAPVAVKTASDGKAAFSFLDLPAVSAIHREDYHAMTVVGADKDQSGEAALVSVLGLGNKRNVAFMLAARVDQPMAKAPNVLPLNMRSMRGRGACHHAGVGQAIRCFRR